MPRQDSIQGSGGFQVTPEMEEIIRQPGYLSEARRGQRLRALYQQNSAGIEVDLLGNSRAPASSESSRAWPRPDLTGTEMPYKFGYATLVVTGSERVTQGPASCDHIGTLRYLLSCGAPPNKEDIVGYTALHHLAINAVLGRLLLDNGADVNHRNRYGEVPIFGAFQNNQVGAVELLMEFGADLSISDADGTVPADFFVKCGPRVTAAVTKWLRKRSGEEAPMDEKKCDECGATDAALKICAKCHSARYCSTACQRAHWPAHKRTCQPFSAANTVTARPCYATIGNLMPTADFTRQLLGIRTDPTPAHHHNSGRAPRVRQDQPKAMVVKVQVPWAETAGSGGDLLVYNKRRDFVCTLRRADGAAAYARIVDVVHARGVGGAKAYFAAELKARDELVVKVGEVLAEQPF
ncbi:hypothetical protein B0H21DRAFT_826677 [Amylocystis lapponica]|nr:hypothetical protein B0H21DRAFT_826677 [Amylocystis lapponica]